MLSLPLTLTRMSKRSVKNAVDSKQPSLLSFLKPKNNDSLPEAAIEKGEENNVPMTPPNKKLKTDEENVNSPAATETPLTPEQRKMIAEKALTARMTRDCNNFKVLDPNMGRTWFDALTPEFRKSYFQTLSDFVTLERGKKTIYPPREHVWEWTKHGPIDQVKVVILGQDPYHGPNQAHGLCFSVKKGVKPPPSLINMYKELQNDIPGFTLPNHGTLLGWTQQGVLLLNAVLTVEAGKANSHKDKGWEKITDSVIRWISMNLEGVVFLLWGAYAQKKAAFVDKKKHHVLQTVHPSPLSAHNGFFGCKHFSRCNEILQANGKTPIDWAHLP